MHCYVLATLTLSIFNIFLSQVLIYYRQYCLILKKGEMYRCVLCMLQASVEQLTQEVCALQFQIKELEKEVSLETARIAQWLERRTRDRKVAGSSPGRSGVRIFFSRVNFLC